MKGIYYKSKHDLQTHFIIDLRVVQPNHNVLVGIYNINIPQTEVNIGDMYDDLGCEYTELLLTIDIWNKYYFTNYNNENNQRYHNYDGRCNTERGMYNVISLAIQLALEKGNIELY